MESGNLIVFSKKQYQQMAGPCVYWIMAQDVPLYIGCSKEGLSRAFKVGSGRWHQERRKSAFAASDRIEVEFFNSFAEAEAREEELIHKYHPQYNIACVCGIKSAESEKVSGDTRRAQTTAGWMRKTQELVKKYGGIPYGQWLESNGLGGLRQRIRLYPQHFQGIARVKP